MVGLQVLVLLEPISESTLDFSLEVTTFFFVFDLLSDDVLDDEPNVNRLFTFIGGVANEDS